MSRKKIALIGAGMIGGTLAHIAAREELGDIVLFDIAEGVPQARRWTSTRPRRSSAGHHHQGANDYAAIAGADVCIVTAGVPRKPGMSRDDLIGINLKVMKAVGEASDPRPERLRHLRHQPARRHGVGAPEILRPAQATRSSAWPACSISARFRWFLAEKFGIAVEDIHAWTLGGHGDDMVPMVRYSTVGGLPLPTLVAQGKISQDGSTPSSSAPAAAAARSSPCSRPAAPIYAPAESAILMALSICTTKRVLACAAYLDGLYGQKDIYCGVPVVIRAGGVKQVIEFPMDDGETAMFAKSIAAVRHADRRLHRHRTEPRRLIG